MVGLKKTLFVAVVALVLAACSDPAEQILTEYPTRLERVLEVDPDQESSHPAAVKHLATRPSRRDLLFALEHADINLLDFLKLNQCQLRQVVGEKNSVLGKLAQGSQYMHLERDFLIHAPACLRTLEDRSLAADLERAVQMKREQRMKVWWNAWVASEEFQNLASVSVYPLAPETEAHSQHTLQAFEYALRQGRQWQASDFDYRTADAEHHLRQWSLGESLGRWQVTQARLTDVLEMSTRMVHTRQREKPLCPTGQKTRKAEIVRNVLERFYIGELQPYMSQSDRFGAILLEHLEKMSEQLGETLPEEWTLWLEQLQQSRARFQEASRTHVQTMSRLFDRCGMSVTGPR